MFARLIKRILIASALSVTLAASATPHATQAAPAQATVVYTFTLTSLECKKLNDVSVDEPRVTVNGWDLYEGTNYHKGDVKVVNKVYDSTLIWPNTPATTFDVEVAELDGSKATVIGSFKITASAKAGLGILSKEVSVTNGLNTTTYKVYYEVNVK